jgi:hypothetical protein
MGFLLYPESSAVQNSGRDSPVILPAEPCRCSAESGISAEQKQDELNDSECDSPQNHDQFQIHEGLFSFIPIGHFINTIFFISVNVPAVN